jgi:hypothetical protein
MSQTWTDDVFATGHAYNTDLGNMENNFAALKSLFSGAAQPASMAACHPWFDTTKHVLKVRNDSDGAWIGLMHGDVSQKVWVYRNAAMAGWAIDSSVTDKVLALKGGSTYVTGGATAGSWTVSGLTNAAEAAHVHAVSVSLAKTNLTNKDSTGNQPVFNTAPGAGLVQTDGVLAGGAETLYQPLDYVSGNSGAGSSHNHVISSDATWRIAASVGTLQYLDL